METKPFFLSKTIWLNVLAVVALVAQSQYGFVIDAETQVALLGTINLILRLITKTAVDWK